MNSFERKESSETALGWSTVAQNKVWNETEGRSKPIVEQRDLKE